MNGQMYLPIIPHYTFFAKRTDRPGNGGLKRLRRNASCGLREAMSIRSGIEREREKERERETERYTERDK